MTARPPQGLAVDGKDEFCRQSRSGFQLDASQLLEVPSVAHPQFVRPVRLQDVHLNDQPSRFDVAKHGHRENARFLVGLARRLGDLRIFFMGKA